NKPNSTDKNKSASEEEAEELEPGKVTPPATTPANQPSPPPPSSSGSLPSPTGQVLNKNLIRLSSTEPQYDPNMNSTCQTLVGATCGVRATLGSKVINIPAVAVDDRGVASIDWNAKAAGLTPGVWDIQVVATKDGKAGYSQTDKLTVEA
ncbi:MAG TPA: hypothetical protein VFK94_00820, partial [Patescibacteria group bacterium]|nr:hypothetical protein [Patescibacteria group bacterium]